MAIRYIFPRFGMLHQEKSGNPGYHAPFSTQAAFFLWAKQKKTESVVFVDVLFSFQEFHFLFRCKTK
jgi:hypothetical protein